MPRISRHAHGTLMRRHVIRGSAMGVLDNLPACRACGPGTVTYRGGEYLCVRCGKPAWISRRLRELRSRKADVSASVGWKVPRGA